MTITYSSNLAAEFAALFGRLGVGRGKARKSGDFDSKCFLEKASLRLDICNSFSEQGCTKERKSNLFFFYPSHPQSQIPNFFRLFSGKSLGF